MPDFPGKLLQTRPQSPTSSVELQPVFLVYAMHRLLAMVKSKTQVKSVLQREGGLLNGKNLHGKEKGGEKKKSFKVTVGDQLKPQVSGSVVDITVVSMC